MTTTTLSPLLSPAETAQLLGVSAGTLAVWRCTKRYALAYLKIGAKIRYRLSDVEKFIETRRHEPQRRLKR